jgi:hypothetical protein
MTRCPGCGATGTLQLETLLAARRPGTASIAGAQPKLLAYEAAQLSCRTCGWSIHGHVEDTELAADGRTFTGGHFVAEPTDIATPPGDEERHR